MIKNIKRKAFFKQKRKNKRRAYVYCDKHGHKASQCKSLKSVEGRRLIFSKKKKLKTALGQNIEPLIAAATNYAVFATQNT